MVFVVLQILIKFPKHLVTGTETMVQYDKFDHSVNSLRQSIKQNKEPVARTSYEW